MSHTPGPWRQGASFGAVVCDTEINPHYESGHDCVEYYGGHLIAESIIREDDARLISASPDLLAALEAVPLPSTSGECEADFCRRFFEWWESHAKPAIDKAKGAV